MNRFEEIKQKAEYCLSCKTEPCVKGCPLENNIPEFINCIKQEKYIEAHNVLCKTTVLAPICARICPTERQCKGNCTRGIKGQAVFINDLESFIGDMAIEKAYGFDMLDKDNIIKVKKKIAVVGSGPAGLTCAAFLARKGYMVTIYEKHEKLGGLLRYGIPEFRLNRDVLEKQIQKILDLGIETICGQELGKDYSLDDLKNEYDAVFLAFGANVSRKMKISGEELEGVFGGNELLENNLHPDYRGKRVAVIGGGNVAMDVSRTVKHLGADKVCVIYRRAEEQMPAEKKEILAAKSEGIEFLFQNNIVSINGKEDKLNEYIGKSNYKNAKIKSSVVSIECVKTELVKKDGFDRLIPVNIEGSNYNLDMDYVILAVGSKVEQSVVSSLGVKLNKWGFVDVDDNFMTSMHNVFAGGDLIGTESTVAWAARNGRDAAEAIARTV